MLNLIKQNLEIKILTPKFNCWNGKHSSHSRGDQIHRSKHGSASAIIGKLCFSCSITWLNTESDVLSSASSQGVPSAYDVLETAMDLTEDHNNTRCVALHENFHNFLRVCPEMLLLATPQKLSPCMLHSLSFEIKWQIIFNINARYSLIRYIFKPQNWYFNKTTKNETLNFKFNHAKIYKSNLDSVPVSW